MEREAYQVEIHLLRSTGQPSQTEILGQTVVEMPNLAAARRAMTQASQVLWEASQRKRKREAKPAPAQG